MAPKKKPAGKPHVRVYGFEMNTPAWQTLKPDAKALLVEMRALLNGRGNDVFMSVREAQRRLSIGQRRVQRAFTDLQERGWISLRQDSNFNWKMGMARSYVMEHEAPDVPGGVPGRKYMAWRPPKTSDQAGGNGESR